MDKKTGVFLIVIIFVVFLMYTTCCKKDYFGSGPAIFEPDNTSTYITPRYTLAPLYRKISYTDDEHIVTDAGDEEDDE